MATIVRDDPETGMSGGLRLSEAAPVTLQFSTTDCPRTTAALLEVKLLMTGGAAPMAAEKAKRSRAVMVRGGIIISQNRKDRSR